MSENPLGEKTKYPLKYDPGLLFPIPRSPTRSLLDIENNMVMHGIDHWRAYEISRLIQP
jgi:7-cyano-7-deazaguanine reductase